jgi:hypothetical protein
MGVWKVSLAQTDLVNKKKRSQTKKANTVQRCLGSMIWIWRSQPSDWSKGHGSKTQIKSGPFDQSNAFLFLDKINRKYHGKQIQCSANTRALNILTVRSQLNEIWRFRFKTLINAQDWNKRSNGYDLNLAKKKDHTWIIFSGETMTFRWQLRSPKFSKRHETGQITYGFVRFFT